MTAKPFEFEKALRELEEITAWFESSDVDLDQGLTKFERGMELSAQLKEHLAGIENRVTKIKQRFATPASAPATAPAHDGSDDDQPAGFDGPQSDLFA
jgi:exodeoxyribonuclease VII small subunit